SDLRAAEKQPETTISQSEQPKETTQRRRRLSPQEVKLKEQGYRRFDPPETQNTGTFWVPKEYDPEKHEVLEPQRGKLPPHKKYRTKHKQPNTYCTRCDCFNQWGKALKKGRPQEVPPCGCSDSDCVEDNCLEEHRHAVILQFKRKEATEDKKEPEEPGTGTTVPVKDENSDEEYEGSDESDNESDKESTKSEQKPEKEPENPKPEPENPEKK